MLGRNSDSYRFWLKEWERYKKIPENIDFANLGSTCDANNFDYSYWNGIGFNFASAPQDMYYDNQILEQYGCHIKNGGYVFISISEFAFLVDKYETDYHNHKYYGYLEASRVCDYSLIKNILLKSFPGLVDNRYIKQEVKKIIKHFVDKEIMTCSIKELSISSMTRWKKEFGWNETAILTDYQKETLEKSWDIFLRNIKFCNENKLIPIVVIPPFNKYLKEVMPKEILDECLWCYIERMYKMGIKVVNFWEDEELEDEKYYRTPICLNEDGKKVFNFRLINEI